MPLFEVFKKVISSPILSTANPIESNPQDTFATEAGANILIKSSISLRNKTN